MTRSTLSTTHFCARRSTRPRPSKPSASHAGCAARAARASSATCSAPRSGTCAMTSPVAGFSTAISPAPAPAPSVVVCSVTLANALLLPRSTRCRRLAVDAQRLDADRVDGAVARVGLSAADPVDDVHPARDLAEDRVLAVEPRGLLGGHDEELRAVGVGARVGHRQRAAHHLVLVDLVLEGVAGAAGAGALRAAALDHEVGDDAMEDEPVVEALAGQLLEVADRLGGLVVEQLEGDLALGRLHQGLGHGGLLG